MKDIDLLISRFQDVKDLEIVATIIALFTDGYYYHYEHIKYVIDDVMGGKPYDYIMQYKMKDTSDIPHWLQYKPIGSFVSMWNLCHLIYALADVYMNYGTLSVAFRSVMSKPKIRYGHEALIELFGNESGFQTKKNSGSFYRLNFLLCILAYKLHILEMTWEESRKCLLPCDDDVFDNMLKNKVIVTNDAILYNVIKITNEAKACYGDNPEDFYMMYYACKTKGNGLR